MKPFKKFFQSAYEDRVKQYVADMVDKPITKVDLDKKLEDTGKVHQSSSPEARLGGAAWKDFKKDVHQHASESGLIQRRQAAPKAPYKVLGHIKFGPRDGETVPVSHEDVAQLAHKIEAAIGNSYPDGDPHDAVTQHMERKGWEPSDAYEKLVPVALKKHLGSKHKNLIDHIHDVWKDADDSTGYDAAKHWK